MRDMIDLTPVSTPCIRSTRGHHIVQGSGSDHSICDSHLIEWLDLISPTAPSIIFD